MGKRSKFEKKPRDFYATIDPVAVEVLSSYVRGKSYAEPCAGAGDLIEDLYDVAKCVWASDIDPQIKSILQKSALHLNKDDVYTADLIITNPPYTWEVLQPLLDHLPKLKPTWLLLPADFMFNKRSLPYMEKCPLVVTIGRMYWEENKVKGKDNYCWFKFLADEVPFTQFIGRH